VGVVLLYLNNLDLNRFIKHHHLPNSLNALIMDRVLMYLLPLINPLDLSPMMITRARLYPILVQPPMVMVKEVMQEEEVQAIIIMKSIMRITIIMVALKHYLNLIIQAVKRSQQAQVAAGEELEVHLLFKC